MNRATAFDRRAFRDALGRFATGVAVVTTINDKGKMEGLTISSFSSVSLDPPLVLWSLQRDALSFDTFAQSGRFSVNVLKAGQSELSNHFATRSIDKFAAIEHHIGANGCPHLPGVLAHFECETVELVDGGDHGIFLGRVQRFEHSEGEPLIVSGGQYHQIAKLP